MYCRLQMCSIYVQKPLIRTGTLITSQTECQDSRIAFHSLLNVISGGYSGIGSGGVGKSGSRTGSGSGGKSGGSIGSGGTTGSLTGYGSVSGGSRRGSPEWPGAGGSFTGDGGRSVSLNVLDMSHLN